MARIEVVESTTLIYEPSDEPCDRCGLEDDTFWIARHSSRGDKRLCWRCKDRWEDEAFGNRRKRVSIRSFYPSRFARHEAWRAAERRLN